MKKINALLGGAPFWICTWARGSLRDGSRHPSTPEPFPFVIHLQEWGVSRGWMDESGLTTSPEVSLSLSLGDCRYLYSVPCEVSTTKEFIHNNLLHRQGQGEVETGYGRQATIQQMDGKTGRTRNLERREKAGNLEITGNYHAPTAGRR